MGTPTWIDSSRNDFASSGDFPAMVVHAQGGTGTRISTGLNLGESETQWTRRAESVGCPIGLERRPVTPSHAIGRLHPLPLAAFWKSRVRGTHFLSTPQANAPAWTHLHRTMVIGIGNELALGLATLASSRVESMPSRGTHAEQSIAGETTVVWSNFEQTCKRGGGRCGAPCQRLAPKAKGPSVLVIF